MAPEFSIWADLGLALALVAVTVLLWLVNLRLAKANETLASLETMRLELDHERARRRLEFIDARPMGEQETRIYRIQVANPGERSVILTSFAWNYHEGKRISVSNPRERTMYVEAGPADTSVTKWGNLRLTRALNIRVLPGHIADAYVRGQPWHHVPMVRSDFVFKGPGMETLRVRHYTMTHTGLQKNRSLIETGARPTRTQNPFERESADFQAWLLGEPTRTELRARGLEFPSEAELDEMARQYGWPAPSVT